jgi:cytochrome b
VLYEHRSEIGQGWRVSVFPLEEITPMQEPATVNIWDPLVRLLHWGLAASFLVAYLSEDELLTLHSFAGYTLLGLIAVRLVWGLIGSRHARFRDFVTPPGQALAYLKDALRLRARRYLGHNPAGGAMVVALLLCLSLTGLSGLVLLGAAEFSGPLAEALRGLPPDWIDPLEETHEFLANLSLVLVVLHLGGVALASLQHRENLVRAMFTGTKRRVVG